MGLTCLTAATLYMSHLGGMPCTSLGDHTTRQQQEEEKQEEEQQQQEQ